MVIAYLSIGEAEDYRFYWNKKKPNWIVKKNKNWERISKKLDEIGIDGYLLNTVDTYQYFEENYKKTLE